MEWGVGKGKDRKGIPSSIPFPPVSAPTGKRLRGMGPGADFGSEASLRPGKAQVNARNSQGSGQGVVRSSKTSSPMTAAGQPSDTHRPSTRASGSHSLKVTETCSLGVGLSGSY